MIQAIVLFLLSALPTISAEIPPGPIVNLGMISAPRGGGDFTAQSSSQELSGVQTLQVTLANAQEFCPNRLANSIENCWFLMTLVSPDSTCTCHNFCNGLFVGCGGTWQGNSDCPGGNGMAYVAGCTFADLQGLVGVQAPPPVPPPVSPPATQTAPQCLSCPPNAESIEACVTDVNAQCFCSMGFVFSEGFCVPATPSCVECPINSNPLVGCVTDIMSQCVCIPNHAFVNGVCTLQTQSIECQACPDGLQPTAGVTCVTNTATQCGCGPGLVFIGTRCLPIPVAQPIPIPRPFPTFPPRRTAPPATSVIQTQCLSCPPNAESNQECITDINAQCVCSMGFVFSEGFCVPATPSCVECPINSNPLIGCVTDIMSQCVCIPNHAFVNGVCTQQAPSIECQACPENLQPIVGVNCVTNIATQCECGPGQIFIGTMCFPAPVPTFPPRGTAAPVISPVAQNVIPSPPVSQVLRLPTFPPRGTAVNLADTGGDTSPDFIFGGGGSSGQGKGGKGKGGKGKGGKGKSEKETVEFGFISASGYTFSMTSTLLLGVISIIAVA